MEIPFISSIEKIVFESCKRVYHFADNKAEIWIKIKFSLKKYYENLIEDISIIHVHRGDNIHRLENIYIQPKILKTVLSEKYVLDIPMPEDMNIVNNPRNIKQFLKKESVAQIETCTGEDLFKEYNKAIILGAPGAGKSTLLKYFAISTIKDEKTKQIPIYVPLRDTVYLKEGLLKYISKSFNQYGLEDADLLIIDLLKDGKLIFLLDGLDEIPNKILSERIEEIISFSTKYKKNKFYITSRGDFYEGQFTGFKELEIDAFDDKQVEEFVLKFLEHSTLDPRDLLDHINSLSQIKELSNSPLLLSLICIVFERDLHIPSRRSTLYKRCIECLIRDWDAQRNFRRDTDYSKFDEEKKISLLSHIAYKLHTENKIYFQISDIQKYVGEIIEKFGIETSEVRKLIREIQSQTGIITQVTKEYMSFSHLTLQEYLTARYLCENGRLMNEIQNKKKNQFWNEVFILSASILPDASEYLNFIITMDSDKTEDMILAANCLSVDPIAERNIKELIVRNIIFYYFNSKKEQRDKCLQAIVRMDKTFVGKNILKQLGVNHLYLENNKKDV